MSIQQKIQAAQSRVKSSSWDDPDQEFIVKAFKGAGVEIEYLTEEDSELVFSIQPDTKLSSHVNDAFSIAQMVKITSVLNRLDIRNAYLTANPNSDDMFELVVVI